MPIKPENLARYPADWKAISASVREAAGQRCEGSPAYPDCRALNGNPHPETGSRVASAVDVISALYVQTGGSYYGLPGVEPWDEARDARRYAGPWPVVAHPPCQRWGKLWAGQPLWIKRTGERKKKGDDGGCFAAALDAVRRFGGVLEHPAGSHAWAHFDISKPPRSGGWIVADGVGGWTCCVEQGRYGHYARKPTWLYAVAVELPALDWGKSEPSFPPEAIERHGLAYCKRAGELAFKGGGKDSAPRIGTPPAFRDILIGMARSAARVMEAQP